VELSAKVVIADNAVIDNGASGVAVMESNDVDVWNNTVLRNERNLDVIENLRTSLNVLSDDHDRRYPVPDPKILWQVQRVTFSNNVIAGKPDAEHPLFRVDDAGHLRSGEVMQVRLNHNAYYRPSTTSPEWLALWARYPVNVLIARRLSEFQSGARQELNGVARDGGLNPWVRSEAALDYRVPESAPGAMGAALPASVANALNRPPGVAVPIGALSLISAPRV
jgi:hypothetical protein